MTAPRAQLLRITSHAGHARYLHTLTDAGFTPRRADIPSPYASGPCHCVYRDPKRGLVIIVETAHKRYDVFRVGDWTVYPTDAEATADYLETRRLIELVDMRADIVAIEVQPFALDGRPAGFAVYLRRDDCGEESDHVIDYPTYQAARDAALILCRRFGVRLRYRATVAEVETRTGK